MYRDTLNRVDATPSPTPHHTPVKRRHARRTALGVTGLLLLALASSAGDAFASAANLGLATPVTAATTVTSAVTYQENSTRVTYTGRWASASYSGYSGGRARASTQSGATATVSFTGNSVAWVGPIGSTRGSAKVYIDGTYVKTVNTHASSFVAARVLFTKSFSTSSAHKLKIVVQGTAGHPMVAIDRFRVTRTSTSGSSTVAPATTGRTVTVSSIPSLLTALDDNGIGQIIVKDGTYRISPSNQTASNSLWIGGRFADRTRAIVVRAETRGGVIFDGGGGSSFGGLSFEDGAHNQTWDGFTFANMAATETGIVEFGGYLPRRSPYSITMRNIKIMRSCTGRATARDGSTWDHGFYIAHSLGSGPHNLLFEDITVDGRGGLASAFHFYHSASGAPNASNVTVRRLHVTGTQQAIILWDPTLRNITFDSVNVTNALAYAVRYETVGSSGIKLSHITSTGSGYRGFYSTLGSHPAGVTFSGVSLH